MNRNPRRALIVATFLILGAGGCTDTTETPISTISDADYFNDPSSYRALLARIYSGLAVSGQRGPAGNGDIQGIDEGFSQYLRLYWEAEELPTDEAVIAWGDPGLPEMNTQLWSSANPFVVAMYYRVAFQVGLANQFLRNTTPDSLAARNVSPELTADIQIWRAEARFLRALSYWHGIDLFGNIPLVTEADPIGFTPPLQSTRQAIFDFLVSELTAMQADLPASTGSGTYGRATKEAAAMLLAKLYMNAGVYTGTPMYAQALAAVQQVIGGPFTLDPSYRHLFQADNNTSPEIIFPIIQDGLRTQTFGGTTFLVHASCGGTMPAANYGVDGCWFGLRLKPKAYNRFDPADPRRAYFWTDQQSVQIGTISNFSEGIPAPKFVNVTSAGAQGSNAVHPDTDFPMFRLGDAYLMYAEAQLRGGGGDPAQSLAYVNALRQRAYGNTSADITAPELTLQFVLDERSRELLWEAHRRTDLVRYGQFTGDTLWEWKGGVAAGIATESFRDLYPLPASELTTNPNLVQNPGY